MRHATKEQFEYRRKFVVMLEQARRAEQMSGWPTRKMAVTTLNNESKERAGKLYTQKKSIKGKSPYRFHLKGRLGGLNVVNIMQGSFPGEDDDGT